MKIKVRQDNLHDGLKKVLNAIDRKNAMPILANVKLAAGGEDLILTATSLEIEISTAIKGVGVEEEGETTVNAGILTNIISKLPNENVELILENQLLTIKSGRITFNLPTLDASDFPILDRGEDSCGCLFDSEVLYRLINNTIFTVSAEESRYYLNGVFFHVSDGFLKAVATDGHRLALEKMECSEGLKEMPDIIIPKTTCLILLKLLESSKDKASFSICGNNKITISAGNTTLTSKLIEGTFPDYTRVIPQENDKTAYFVREELIELLERVGVISSERIRSVKFSVSKDILELEMKTTSNGVATDEMECESDNAIIIGFNIRYLLDILSHLDEETVQMDFSEPSHPVIIKNKDSDGSLAVVMPMRV